MESIEHGQDSEMIATSMPELSPFDSAFPINLLSSSLNDNIKQAETLAGDVYQSVAQAAPVLAQILHAKKTSYKYVVQMPDEVKKAIESGALKLSTDSNGQMFAQLLDESGHFSTKFPIKKESLVCGFNPVMAANTLQMKAMQDQLKAISLQIKQIDQSVKSILQGQQNDRIGQYYSGISLYIEARDIDDPALKKSITAQAMRALSDSIFQIKLHLESDIAYLTNQEYKAAKGKRVELIDSRMRSINQCFAVIHQAFLLKAGIYCEQGEISAMTTVLNEYAHFIAETISGNAKLLSQWDLDDDGSEQGIWKSRANLKIDIEQFRKQITSKEKVIYLSVTEGDE